MLEIQKFHISVEQLVTVGIIPVLRQLVSQIVPCFSNTDIFGYFRVTDLFITGSPFGSKYNDDTIFDYIVTMELRKGFKQLMEKCTDNTVLHIYNTTHHQTNESLQKPSYSLERKPFCYDIFVKGDLRIVSSRTYSIVIEPQARNVMRYVSVAKDGSEIKGTKINVINEKDELIEKKLYVKVFASKEDKESEEEDSGDVQQTLIYGEQYTYYGSPRFDNTSLGTIGNIDDVNDDLLLRIGKSELV